MLKKDTVTEVQVNTMNNITDLVVISGGLSVPAWARWDRQTLPAFLLLEQVLQPGRGKSITISIQQRVRAWFSLQLCIKKEKQMRSVIQQSTDCNKQPVSL